MACNRKFRIADYAAMADSVIKGRISLKDAEIELEGQKHIDYFWYYYYVYAMPLPEFVPIRVSTQAEAKLKEMQQSKEDTMASIVDRLLGISSRIHYHMEQAEYHHQFPLVE